MAKTKMVLQPLWPNPRNFPINKLKGLDRELTRVLRDDIGKLILFDFEDTIEGWEAPPRFIKEYKEPPGSKQISVFPSGPNTLKWARVSEGTPPHIIAARRRSILAFKREYVPHTKPGGPYGGPGVKIGPWITPKSVAHPGTTPRKFSVIIKEAREDEIYDKIYRAFEKFVFR